MAFNLELLKKHPYATGGIVIIGGITVFYLLSQSGASGVSASSGNSDYLAADSAVQQANAAAAIQTNAQQAAVTQAQIAANVSNTQTAASVTENQTNTLAGLVAALSGNKTSLEVTQSNNNAATLQAQNAEITQQNEFTTQEQGLEAQINEQYNLNANNNATNLAGLVDTLNEQGQIASQTLNIAGTLATNQQNAYDAEIPFIVQNAGQQKNSALDATDQTNIFQTILAGGNPTVAVAGVASGTTANVAGEQQTSSIIGSITKLGSVIGAGLFA